MHLSTRGEYSVRTMLALASAYGKGPLSLSQIAQQERLSLAYLEQLALALRRSGLVTSVRGARGGYHLALHPNRVTLGDILRAADESIGPVECVEGGNEHGGCKREAECAARPAWARLRNSMIDMLNSTTLADLCAPAANSAGNDELAREGQGFQEMRYE